MNNGFILIHRKLLKWQWYKDSNTLHLFIDLLLDANYEESKVGFEIIKRGQCLTSLNRIHENTGLTYQQIRTSLSKLEKSGEINKQTTNRYSIITINKYDEYQDINKQITNKQQTDNNIKKEIIKNNTNKEINNKESISKDIPKKVEKKYFESLRVNTLFNEFLELRKKIKAVNSERAIKTLVNKLNNYDEDTQYKMIENSIVNSWKDVYELKEKKSKRKDVVFDTLQRIYNEGK